MTSVDPQDVDSFAERMLASTLGAMETMSVYVGDRLGWYRSLKVDGCATSSELAQRTGTDERYTREWLELQAVYGILAADSDLDSALERRYTLPPAAAEVLTDEHSVAYLGPLPRFLMAAASQMPELIRAYQNGGGVSWSQFGQDARECQAALNRPLFENQLGIALAGVSKVHDVLSRPGARILEVGFGAGWSTIALAQAYPQAQLVGIDIDEPSAGMARRNAAEAGVQDRIEFRAADADSAISEGGFDAAFAFECIHDLPRPIEVLAAMNRAVKPDGLVIVMDEAVANTFTAPGDELERFMYGASMFICLPDGLSSPPSVGTGTVMRPTTLDRYAKQAGFAGIDILPIEGFGFFRFYSLHR